MAFGTGISSAVKYVLIQLNTTLAELIKRRRVRIWTFLFVCNSACFSSWLRLSSLTRSPVESDTLNHLCGCTTSFINQLKQVD